MGIDRETNGPDYSLEWKRIDSELSGGGDVGNFLTRDLGLLIAAERPVSMAEILAYKAGSLRTLTPEDAKRQQGIHEQALQKLVAAGIVVQEADRFSLAQTGAEQAWINDKIESGAIRSVVAIGREFLEEQAAADSSS